MDLDTVGTIIERWGTPVLMMLWFMHRDERRYDRLMSKVNKLIIVLAGVAKTVDRDDDHQLLVNAVADENSSDKEPK